MFLVPWPNCDLIAIQMGMVDFVLGGSAWVALNVLKLQRMDTRCFRVVQVHIRVCCFFIHVNIPLYPEHDDLTFKEDCEWKQVLECENHEAD